MHISYRKLGGFIEEIDIRNKEGNVKKLFGLSVGNCFCKSKTDISTIDIEDYKIVSLNNFAWRAIDVGRDGMSIALSFFREKILVSPSYIVFKVKNNEKLNPYYLFLFLRKKEFERYARYHSWGSIRESFNWSSLCNFFLPCVSFEKQKALIEELRNLDEQIQVRKKLHEDLRNIIVLYKRFFHDPQKETALRENVKLISRKNKDNKVKHAVGISWKKTICEYGAIIRNEDFSKLQIVKKHEFVWNEDLKYVCCLSCWMEEEPTLVSGSYRVFSIVDKKLLSSGYLMACFFDSEFDRYSAYHSFGSSRDRFKPPQLLNFKISLIDPEIQTLFSYLYELFLISEKIIDLCEKRREIVLENFEYLL